MSSTATRMELNTGATTVSEREKTEASMSSVALDRLNYKPRYPHILDKVQNISVKYVDETTMKESNAEVIQTNFTNTFGYPICAIQTTKDESEFANEAINIGILFCGRQTAGGHNVITGVFDYIKQINKNSKLYGFIGGNQGLFQNKNIELTKEKLALYRNSGGFDLLGRGSDKIGEDKYELVAKTCEELQLNGLILVGGAWTASDAASLSESFLLMGIMTRVICVPVDYSRDIKNNFVETTVGFDTASKVMGNIIGNICTDAKSARKYYHFIRVMGRNPSHIVLEIALQTHATYAIISEEVAEKHQTLLQIVNQIADVICERAENNLNYGVIIIPEGLVNHISELTFLLQEIDTLMKKNLNQEQLVNKLSPWNKALFEFLPTDIQKSLFDPRESRGAWRSDRFSMEILLSNLVEKELERRREDYSYEGHTSFLTHYFGYESRTSFPSLFDCDYAYSLGRVAAALIQCQLTGYMATLRNLNDSPLKWIPNAIPLTAMTTIDMKQGVYIPSIATSQVDLHDKPFVTFAANRKKWATQDDFCNPGPIQFYGETASLPCLSLSLEEHTYLARIEELRQLLDTIRNECLPGCPNNILDISVVNSKAILEQIQLLKRN
ncbi:hypothetical protein WA158_004730 [Blastocystis sp. Blastoise]